MTHTKQLLLVTFCCTNAGIAVSFWTHARTHARAEEEEEEEEGQTYVEVEIVI